MPEPIKLIEPFRRAGRLSPDCQSRRIGGNVLAVSVNDVIAGCPGYQARSGLERRVHFLADHQFGFVKCIAATQHQLHHSERNDAA
jgi:hypothetical protein